jgi:hypothetical protein
MFLCCFVALFPYRDLHFTPKSHQYQNSLTWFILWIISKDKLTLCMWIINKVRNSYPNQAQARISNSLSLQIGLNINPITQKGEGCNICIHGGCGINSLWVMGWRYWMVNNLDNEIWNWTPIFSVAQILILNQIISWYFSELPGMLYLFISV